MVVRILGPDELELVLMRAWDYAASASYETKRGCYSLPLQRLVELYAADAEYYARALMDVLGRTSVK